MRRYGASARPLLAAYASASQTQLNYATATGFTWDFTIYGEGMMVFGRGGVQPMSVEQLIGQKPLLPNWLSIEDFVEMQRKGQRPPSEAVTPLKLADIMETDGVRALDLVKGIDSTASASLTYEIADIKAWANLGLYYAEKLRGAVALQTFRKSGNLSEKRAAVSHLERSLAHWDEVVSITRPIYKDMPLAHYNPPDNRRNDKNLFHWALLRPAIASDIEVARSATFNNSDL